MRSSPVERTDLLVNLILHKDDPLPPMASFDELPLKSEGVRPSRGWISKLVDTVRGTWKNFFWRGVECLPLAMLTISILQVLAFCWLSDTDRIQLMYDPRRPDEWWRYLSYMLVHTDSLHVSLNIVIQLILSIPLEMEQGSLRTLLTYLGGGVGGALGTSLLDPESFVVGSSAGVYALLISHSAHIYLNQRCLKYIAFRCVVVLLLTLTDLCFIVYHHIISGNMQPRIGWQAHVAGGTTGLLLGLICFRSSVEHKQRVLYIRVASAIFLCAFCFLCIIHQSVTYSSLPHSLP